MLHRVKKVKALRIEDQGVKISEKNGDINGWHQRNLLVIEPGVFFSKYPQNSYKIA